MTARSTIPALAAAMRDWFPELGGRVIPVSLAEVTKENIPELPIAMVALRRLGFDHSSQSNAAPKITEDLFVEFWLKPEQYRLEKGGASPFWAYYDYDAILDKLTAHIMQWTTPRGTRLALTSMEISADALAVVLTFGLSHLTKWCPEEVVGTVCNPVPLPEPLQISFGIVPADRPAGQPCECVPAVPNCPTCQERTTN